MISWMILAAFSFVLAGYLVYFAWPAFLVRLAKSKITPDGDKWWNPVCLLPPSGEMYILVAASADGAYKGLLESVVDNNFDPVTHKFSPDPSKKASEGYFASYGIAWVGFFTHLLRREIEHVKYNEIDPSTRGGLERKVRPGPAIFFRWNMAVVVDAAEIKGNLAVNATIIYTVQLTDPVRALFFAGGWEKQVAAAIQGRFRRYSPDKTFEELVTEQKAGVPGASGRQTISSEIIKLSEFGPDDNPETGLYPLFGVQIIDARFVKVDIVGSDEARESIQALEIAKRKAEAQKAQGKGKGDELKEIAEGIEAQMRAYRAHPDAAKLAFAKAIEVAKPAVIGAGVIPSIDVPVDRKVVTTD